MRQDAQGRPVDVAVWITPGQADNAIGVVMGWGRQNAGRYGNKHGFDVMPLRSSDSLGFVDDNLTTIYPTLGGAGRYSDIRVGWTAGGGLEWAFTPNWTLKAEALYYDLGSASFASSPVGAMDPDGTNGGGFAGAPLFANSPVTRVRYDGVIARAGLNYHFTWGETPIVAKF